MARKSVTPVSAATIRAWGNDNGFPVKTDGLVRGRLNPALVEKYLAAHPGEVYTTNANLPAPTRKVTVGKAEGFKTPRTVNVTLPQARAASGKGTGKVSQEAYRTAAVAIAKANQTAKASA